MTAVVEPATLTSMTEDNVRNIKEMRALRTADRWLLGVVCFAITAVIIINFITSYGHIYVEGLGVGETGVDARLMPIGIDGVLFALALLNVFVTSMNRSHWLLRSALAFGVAGTVAANAAYGARWGMTGGLIATWSPVALFIVVEAGLYGFRVATEAAQEAARPKRGRPVGSTGVNTQARPPRAARTTRGAEVAIPELRGRVVPVDVLNPFEDVSEAALPVRGSCAAPCNQIASQSAPNTT